MHKILNKCHPLVFRDAGHQAIVQDSSETATLYTINFDQLCTFYEYYMLCKPRPAQDLCRRVSDLTRRHQNKIPRMWILSPGVLKVRNEGF